MATEVTLPELGESVTEGTITAWLVAVGDTVEVDQPLFELSSDKIDTEVPSPVGGVVTEIKVEVDQTVDVGTVVALIGEADEASGSDVDSGDGDGDGDTAETDTDDAETDDAETDDAEADEGEPGAAAEADDDDSATGTYERAENQAETATSGDSNGAGILVSPLVRRLATERNIDLSSLSGSGDGGRITRADVEQASSGGGKAAPPSKTSASSGPGKASAAERPATGGDRTRTEDLSRIRQRIAAKMMESQQSSAQLTTVQEADVTRIMKLRGRVKDEFKAREGVSLSPFVFLCRAAVLAIRNHPSVNAKADWDAGKVTYREYVNLGIAVDSPKGLIVPNIKGADDLSLAGLARSIRAAADKARGVTKLEIADIEGGTFTVTNTGSRGVLIDTPILNYPEVAILGTGAIKPRPVVIQDDAGPAIAIRDMVYLCLTYDHRLIDGADAARFVTDVAEIVGTHDWAAEIGY